MVIRKPRREFSPKTNHPGPLILDLPVSRTMRKLISVIEGTQPVVVCHGSQSRLIHLVIIFHGTPRLCVDEEDTSRKTESLKMQERAGN